MSLGDLTPAEALTIRPGDKLVLRYQSGLSRDQVARVEQWVADLLPGVVAVVIHADQMLVYKQSEPA